VNVVWSGCVLNMIFALILLSRKLSRPPFSHDLATSDFCLFPVLEDLPRGVKCQSFKDFAGNSSQPCGNILLRFPAFAKSDVRLTVYRGEN
jgi:hypothetical protein